MSHLAQTGILSGLADCWFMADVPLVATPSPQGISVVLTGLPEGLGDPAGLGEGVRVLQG